MIPFAEIIPPEECDPHLIDKLLGELPGIFNWAREGCNEWQKLGGLNPPEEVKQATLEYREDMDLIGEFIDDCCIVDPKVGMPVRVLFAKFMEWCDEQAMPTSRRLSMRGFGNQIQAKGFNRVRTGESGTRSWSGIGLKRESQEL